ncbi:MAG: alpha/beta hydrolase [Pseudomonadota bacterium]
MPLVHANGIDLCWEAQGAGDPIVLIMGIDAQLVHWPQGFCDLLAARGLRVIRFDNRDTGLSGRLDHLGTPSLARTAAQVLLGRPPQVPYTLDDMATDTLALIDALGLDRVHLVGQSMGGMIAQCAALAHPERFWSLTSISSTPAWHGVLWARPRVVRTNLKARPPGLEAGIAYSNRTQRAMGGPAHPMPEDVLHAITSASNARGHSPTGTLRQAAAILASGDRTRRLASLAVPTLVLHGDADPVIHLRGGRATAAAIPGARLQIVPGWGHDLPPTVWPILVEAIAGHAHAARNQPRNATSARS